MLRCFSIELQEQVQVRPYNCYSKATWSRLAISCRTKVAEAHLLFGERNRDSPNEHTRRVTAHACSLPSDHHKTPHNLILMTTIAQPSSTSILLSRLPKIQNVALNWHYVIFAQTGCHIRLPSDGRDVRPRLRE